MVRKHLLTLLDQSYISKVLGIESADLIAYWPMNELSGAVAVNVEGTAARNGAYTGVTLGQTGIGDGNACPLFDGANDYCDVHSASLNTAFSGVAGTVQIWGKPPVGAWTDGVSRRLIQIYVDGNNRIYIGKSSANNAILFLYVAGGTAESVTINNVGPSIDWKPYVITWDFNAGANGEVKAYISGVQVDVTKTNLGVWAGNLDINATNIGSNLHPTNVWDGLLAHVPIWTKALSATQIANLATV